MNLGSRSKTNGANQMRIRMGVGLLAAVLLGAACDTDLDLTNPNAPTEETAVATIEGILAVNLGMQEQLASSILTYVRAPALITDEWGPGSRALAADQSLFTGDPDPSFGVVSGPYFSTYRVARSANLIIENVPALELGVGLESGLLATARLFKAMALGFAALHYERLPLDASVEGSPLVSREEALTEVIRLLEEARSDIADVSDEELSTFRTRALTPGFDLRNTIDAMLARYYLFSGQYQQALDAANRVDLEVVSEFRYTDPDLNPIYNYSELAVYVFPLASFVEDAEPGDQRVAFWVDVDGEPPPANPPTLELLPFALYGDRNAPFPVYLPGEILLIRAEAQARLGDLAAARDLINQVRTRMGTATTLGASLPPLPADALDTLPEVLRQIAYERRYELYSQGLRWEDLRRLGEFVDEDLDLRFLPLPEDECRTNPNCS